MSLLSLRRSKSLSGGGNMVDFPHINEEEFLKGYAEFTAEIRPFIIKRLVAQYRCTTSRNEKEMFYILAIEQSFLFLETFMGFYQAIRDCNQKSVLQSLKGDVNIQNLYESLGGKGAKAILSELNLPIGDFAKDVQKEIKERFVKLVSLFQNDSFCKFVKSAVIPVFNKLKHKMLLYKNNQGEVAFVLEKDKEIQLNNWILQENDSLPKNIDYLFDIAERFKSAIQDLIAVRLKELEG